MSSSRFKNQRAKVEKKDISLLTLLANESTADSRKLLKKYGKEDSTDYEDLEKKLADLYFSSTDKIQLEKEMAQIHPHKKWLLKYETPKIEIKKEEPKVNIVAQEEKAPSSIKVVEQGLQHNCSQHGNNCPYHEREHERMRMSDISSSFEGGLDNKSHTPRVDTNTIIAVLGIIGIVSVLGIILNKNK